jgi:hypothetical protein
MQDDPNIRAFSIAELLKLAPIGRSTLYAAIKAGRLRIRKPFGKRTVVLKGDWEAFLAGSPEAASVTVPTGRRPRGRPRKVPAPSTTTQRVPSENIPERAGALPAPPLQDHNGSHLGEGRRRYKKIGKTTERGVAE